MPQLRLRIITSRTARRKQRKQMLFSRMVFHREWGKPAVVDQIICRILGEPVLKPVSKS